jgi:phosphohistidine phosphatase SixA
MLKRLLMTLAILGATAAVSTAQTTYFIVRHAERADGPGSGMGGAADPSLSAAGRARAASLATILKDEKVTAVFTTEFKRTQQTAAPTAKAHGVTPTTVTANDTATLVQKLKAATGVVLVVGHSNTVPEIVAGLGISTPVTVGDTEFDHLFIVAAGERPTLIQLRYK